MTNRRQVLLCESSVYMFPRFKFKRSQYATVVCRSAFYLERFLTTICRRLPQCNAEAPQLFANMAYPCRAFVLSFFLTSRDNCQRTELPASSAPRPALTWQQWHIFYSGESEAHMGFTWTRRHSQSEAAVREWRTCLQRGGAGSNRCVSIYDDSVKAFLWGTWTLNGRKYNVDDLLPKLTKQSIYIRICCLAIRLASLRNVGVNWWDWFLEKKKNHHLFCH